MSDIATLESRITAALDRIRQGIDSAATPTDERPVGEVAQQGELEQARAQAVENGERVRRLKKRERIAQEQHASEIAALTARVETQSTQLQKLDAELQQLRASNVELRALNTKLREAVTTGLAPELHDAAVNAEMAALHAQRAADAAEVDAILDALRPLIKETTHAAD